MDTCGRLMIMGKNSAAMNMAIDEAILITRKETPTPTLRFYDWANPAFSFGYFQNIASDVDVQACRQEKIELVKRMTGGGTVLHGWDLTYSLILPRYSGEKSVSQMYQQIGKNLVNAFVKLGIPASLNCISKNQSNSSQNLCLIDLAENDVLLNNKKIAGVSVRRNRNGILFQGYISLDMPPNPILKRVSKHPEIQEMLCEKSAAINTDRRSIKRRSLIQAICETYEIGITFNSGKLSQIEREQAETLVRTKYATAAWNFL